MHKQHGRARIFALLLGVAALIFAGWTMADPPARVARLGYTSGAVSFSPAGENEWVRAAINRPLTTGDRLWVDAGARAELQVGSSVIRMGELTSVALLNLEDRVAQVQLAQGTLNVRVHRLGANEVFEVNTPNLAYSIRRPGEYRIDVDPSGNSTAVMVRNGQAEVYGDGAAYVVNAQQGYRFAGTSLRDYEYFEAPRADEFDRWSSDRDRRGAVSARYVSRDVIGYEDLDEHGSWRNAEGYGNVWVPNRVAAGWAPYRDGHWAWVDPWGWTWVDDAPWGFAVSHYGRWANLGGTWGWVPGPIRAQAVYAPALVAFIGGSNFRISSSGGDVGGVAWFPLGPRDVYRPSYPVSRSYFNNINTSNTTVNTTTITNVYNTTNVRNITYVNQQVPGAIVAIPSTAFVQSQPVGRAAVRLSKEAIAAAPVTAVAAVVPVRASVHGAAAPSSRPPAEVLKRRVVAKAPPPPAPVPFAAKQAALAADPGKPLNAAALAAVKPSTAPGPTPSVKVVTAAHPVVSPPRQQAVAPGGPQAAQGQKGPQPSDAKKGPRTRDAQEAPPPVVSVTKPPEPQPAPESPKAPPPVVSVTKPPEARQAQQTPEAQKKPQPSDAKKGPPAREAQEAPPPVVSVTKPPEARQAQQAPEAQKGTQPPDAKKGPRTRDAQEARQAQQAPEAQKGPQPSDAKKGPRTREAQETPPPVVSVAKPPEAQQAQRAPEVQKATPTKSQTAKSAEKPGATKSDEQRKREEQLKREEEEGSRKP